MCKGAGPKHLLMFLQVKIFYLNRAFFSEIKKIETQIQLLKVTGFLKPVFFIALVSDKKNV